MKIAVSTLLILLTGCITAAYKKSNVEYSHVYREFNMAGVSGERVYKGTYEGVREIDGGKYHYLQFDGLLKGQGRFLDVMLPLKGRLTRAEKLGPDGRFHETDTLITRPGLVSIRESSIPIAGTHPAYLIFKTTSSGNMDSFYALFNLKTGHESDPVELMKRHFKYDINAPVYPLAALELNFVLNYSYSTRAIVWDRDPDGKTRVACEGIDVGNYDGPRLAVEWKERNKLVYGLRQFGYAGTVIADVVTSPVQLVMLVLTGLAGPGVR
jgi:hypothetical protein